MSVKNISGAPFAILNKQGYYDFYDHTGKKINLLTSTIRITQYANRPDQMLIIGLVNVVRDEEEMSKIINNFLKTFR